MKKYYRYALNTPDNKEELKEELIRRDDDNILSQRDGHPLAARLDARKPYSWTRRLLENARRSLDVLFAGPEVWDFLDNKPNDGKQESKRNCVNPKSGLRVAWYNLGFHYIEQARAYIEKARALDQDKDKEEEKELTKQLFTLPKQLITTAADAGNVVAARNLGILYRDGDRDGVFDGVFEGGSEKARKYFHQAAEQGDTKAQIALGEMYRKGDGVQKELELAVEWFKKAEVPGSVEAQMNIAEILYCKSREESDGWRRELNEAEKKCQDVRGKAKKPDERNLLNRALYCLARIQHKVFLNTEKEYKNREIEYKHYVTKENELNELAEQLKQLKEQAEEFMNLYRKAADLGHDGARYELGIIPLSGLKVDKFSTRFSDRVEVNDELVLVPQDLNKAARYLREVGEWKNGLIETLDSEVEYADLPTKARIELAKMYVEGRLSAGDTRAVLKWLPRKIKDWKEKRECEEKRSQGNHEGREIPETGSDASYVLGAIYRDGIACRGRDPCRQGR